MTLKRFIPVVLGLTLPNTPALSSDTSGLAGYLSPEALAAASKALGDLSKDGSQRRPKKRSSAVVDSVADIDRLVVEKTRASLRELVLSSDAKDNKAFQGKIETIREYSYQVFLKKLPTVGQDGRPDELNKAHHAKIWRDALNEIYTEIKADAVVGPVAEPVDLPPMDDEDDTGSHEAAEPKAAEPKAAEPKKAADFDMDEDEAARLEAAKKINTFKTTLLSMLMRRSESKELALKVQTLIEHGADKNLNPEFNMSAKMANQAEYPLKIALDEISDNATRVAVLEVLLNDRVIYTNNDKIEVVGNKLEPILKTLQIDSNAEYVLESLLEKEDFKTFNEVLTYLEKSNIFVSEKFEDKISQIEDQVCFPILEKVLQKMRAVRVAAISTDKDGKRVDNIDQFYSSKALRGHLNRDNHDTRFNQGFRDRLTRDFQALFTKIAGEIDLYRKETELEGSQLQGMVIEWAKWAHFRNRIAVHLNKFALTASNKAEKSNIVRLIRYANIANESGMQTEDDEIFHELRTFGGKDIIFMRRNKYGWTPLMYAMVQKQSEGLQLYLRQSPHEVTMVDGVENNLMHLAFPLPEQYFKGEGGDGDDNVMQMVGAALGLRGAREKTSEALQAILTEEKVDKADKIKALKHLSAANYTPVSLAAAMGFADLYDDLQEWLKGQGAWNRDEHSYLNRPVEELVVIGLREYLKSKEDDIKAGNVKPEEMDLVQAEITRTKEKIDQRQKDLDALKATALQVIYHTDSALARDLMKMILDPVMKELDTYEGLKGTKRGKEPYPKALEIAYEMMMRPPQEVYQVEDVRRVTKTILKTKEVYVPQDKFLGFIVRKDKIVRETFPVQVESTEKYTRDAFRDGPLAGMKNATSVVKSSYLAQVVRAVMTRYLQHHTHPRYLPFDAVYKSLTGSETMEYFMDKYNVTVEKRMQEVIRDILKAADRLRDEEKEEKKSSNRFDNMGGGAFADDMRDFGGDDSGSEDDNDAEEEDDDAVGAI